MPLPSRNVSAWIYSSLADVPGLESRESYLLRYRPVRISLLRDAIRGSVAEGSRAFVGTTESATWAEIAGADFRQGPARADWAHLGPTRFVILNHPTAYGAKNSYFENVGRARAL
jgi:hypothetical protein